MFIVIGSLVFILGLLIGSFLNAYIYRLSVNQSVWQGRSYCPHCHQTLAAKDLLPLISFIGLRGRCRYCGRPISWQYPLVELATALAWLGLYLSFGWSMPLVVYASWTAILIVIFVYDLLHELILDKVTVPAGLFVFVTAYFVNADFINLLLALLVGGGFFLIQHVLTNGRWVGGGDVRLGALMGLMLGWPAVLLAIGLAYMLGAVIGLGLIASGQKKLSSHVPFGTFLAAATYAAFFIGTPLLDRYFR